MIPLSDQLKAQLGLSEEVLCFGGQRGTETTETAWDGLASRERLGLGSRCLENGNLAEYQA